MNHLSCCHFPCDARLELACEVEDRLRFIEGAGWTRQTRTWAVPGGTTIGFYYSCPDHGAARPPERSDATHAS